MNILDELAEYAKVRVKEAKKLRPLDVVKTEALSKPKGDFEFEKALKKDGMSFVVGGTVRTGNVDNREVSYGPKNNTAHDQYYSYEEGYWNLDLVWFAATSHVVLGLALEDYTYRMFLGPRFQYFGVQGWAGLSPSDRRKEKDNPKVVGGVMLIEQFPISEKIKVGLSEHI